MTRASYAAFDADVRLVLRGRPYLDLRRESPPGGLIPVEFTDAPQRQAWRKRSR
jgi:hypothetical protein